MVTLNNEQASLVKTLFSAIKSNFRYQQGMNIGSSSVHNIYPNDLRIIEDVIKVIDENVK